MSHVEGMEIKKQHFFLLQCRSDPTIINMIEYNVRSDCSLIVQLFYKLKSTIMALCSFSLVELVAGSGM